MKAEQNELVTRIGPGTRLRRACCAATGSRWRWSTNSIPRLDPRMAQRPLKAVRVLGQDLVLFRDDAGPLGPARPRLPAPRRRPVVRPPRGRRPALPLPRLEVRRRRRLPGDARPSPPAASCASACASAATRCWKGAASCSAGSASEGSEPPPLPAFDCFAAPATHTFAFKGLWNCNWLQAFEVGIDPAHPSFLHRFLNDASLDAIGDNAAGKQFRSASAGESAASAGR